MAGGLHDDVTWSGHTLALFLALQGAPGGLSGGLADVQALAQDCSVLVSEFPEQKCLLPQPTRSQ